MGGKCRHEYGGGWGKELDLGCYLLLTVAFRTSRFEPVTCWASVPETVCVGEWA